MKNDQLRLNENVGKSVAEYVDGIAVPPYSAEAVAARRRTAPRQSFLRWTTPALATVALLVAAAITGPAVVAQVASALHALLTVGGRTEPVHVSNVTFQEAQAGVPFAVIAPAGIPSGLTETIEELDPQPSHRYAQLIFRFHGKGSRSSLIIIERSAARERARLRIWMTPGAANAFPVPRPLLSAISGHKTIVYHVKNGRISRQIAMRPFSWVVRGTRIFLISSPGFLNDAQLLRIRQAMRY